MPIAVFWDQSFNSRFGGGSEARARAVLFHTQVAYNWNQYLGTTITFEIKSIAYRSNLNIAPSVEDL